MSIRSTSWIASLALAASAALTQASMHSYYAGIDNLATLPSGTYAGLANPNYNNLTLLFAHHYDDAPSSNHYHGKAIRAYTGPNLGAGTAVIWSAGNYVPEGAIPPINLTPGTGIYSGKLVSNPYTDVDDPTYAFSKLTLGNVQSLSTGLAGSGEEVLFNSSGGRWNAAFDEADVHWELVGVTPGLNVGSQTVLNLVSPGQDVHLGEGSEWFEFTPVLWTDADAAPGIYEAAFRLVDESGTFGSSGEVRIVTQVVPEPASLGALGLLTMGLMRRARRR